MFRKIISKLPFSPTLISELGFYAKRLRKEEATRRLGLVLTALALVVQSFVVFSPPESANAANPGDLVYGGIHTKTQLVAAWDNNTQGYRDLLQHAGLTRAQVVNMKDGEINSRSGGKDSGWLTWNRISKGGAQYSETSMMVGSQTIYVRSLAAFDVKNTTGNGSYYPAFIGTNSRGESVTIMKGCANITMKSRPPSRSPAATCVSLAPPVITNRINVALSSSASAKDGAAIQSHVFTLHDSSGKQINQRVVNTTATTASSSMELSTPGSYKAKVVIMTSIGKKESASCEKPFTIASQPTPTPTPKPTPTPTPTPTPPAPTPTPVASCQAITVKKLSRNEFQLGASANTSNGATIKSYTFIVKDSQGKEVYRKSINTPASSTTATIDKALADGNYSAEVIVGTSLGNRSAAACLATFTVEPIQVCAINPSLPINHPDCQPCPADPKLWVKDEDCAAKVVRSKRAANLTANAPAHTVKAKASDRIEYTLTATNEGKADATFDFSDGLIDVLEYASLYDRGGGKLDEETRVISWESVALKPGESQSRTYVVQLASQISPMSRGTSDPSSYDCQMINTFGNTIEIEVDCPAPKMIEQVVPELPRTGPGINLAFGGILAGIVTFLYARSRQLGKEIRLIRKEVTAGTI